MRKMKILKQNIFSGILMVTLLFFITSCGINESFLRSSVVPAATGYVKVKKDENQNYAIKLKVNDLAESDRLQSSKKMYVVWMQTENGNFENLGQLQTSTGFMSKQRTASMETVSTHKPVRFFITAENEQNVQFPDRETILTTAIFYKR
jgi:hypothetical protein